MGRHVAVGHPASVARGQAWPRGRSRHPAGERRRRCVGCGLRAPRRARKPPGESLSLPGRQEHRNDGGGLRARESRKDLRRHRHSIPSDQHSLPAVRCVPLDAEARRRGELARDDSRPVQLLAERRARLRVHGCDDDAVCRCDRENVGHAAVVRDRSAYTPPGADCPARFGLRHDTAHRVGKCVRDSGHPARVSRHGVGRRVGKRPPIVGVHQLRNMVSARHGADRAGAHAQGSGSEFHQRGRRGRNGQATEEHRRFVAAAVMPALVGG